VFSGILFLHTAACYLACVRQSLSLITIKDKKLSYRRETARQLRRIADVVQLDYS